MANDNNKSPAEQENYGAVVARLEKVVQRLEGGELSLEESLQSFEEGIRLVRSGEALLSEAERRVEQLLSAEGQLQAVPLDEKASKPSSGKAKPPTAVDHDDDVPF